MTPGASRLEHKKPDPGYALGAKEFGQAVLIAQAVFARKGPSYPGPSRGDQPLVVTDWRWSSGL